MAGNPNFIGRKEIVEVFKKSIEAIDKPNGLFSGVFGKKTTQQVPQIFMFDGEGGFGKSTLTNECVRIAKDITKDKIKVVSIDFQGYYLHNSPLENNSRKIISALYTRIIKDDKIGLKKYFLQYEDWKQKVEQVEQKVKEAQKTEGLAGEISEIAAQELLESLGDAATGLPIGKVAKMAGKAGDKLWSMGETKTRGMWEKHLLKEELDLYRNADKTLTDHLVEGLQNAAKDAPILLVIDTFEEVENKDVDSWLFTAFLKELYTIDNQVVIILSGRNNRSRAYQTANLPSHLLQQHTLGEFAIPEVMEFAQLRGWQLDQDQAKKINKFISGIPLLLDWIFSVQPNKSVNQLIDELRRSHQKGSNNLIFKELIEDRILKYCQKDIEILWRVYTLAMMPKIDYEALAFCWQVDETEIHQELKKLAQAHSFVDENGNIHALIKDQLRNYLRSQDTVKVQVQNCAINLKIFYEARLKNYEETWEIEDRYENEEYCHSLIKYFNALMWASSDAVLLQLPRYLLEIWEFRWALAINILFFKVPFKDKSEHKKQFFINSFSIAEFKPYLSKPQKDEIELLQNATMEYLPLFILKKEEKGKFLNKKLLQNLTNLLNKLDKASNRFQLNDFQQKLLKYKQAEVYFISQQFEQAEKLLEELSNQFQIKKINYWIGCYLNDIGVLYLNLY